MFGIFRAVFGPPGGPESAQNVAQEHSFRTPKYRPNPANGGPIGGKKPFWKKSGLNPFWLNPFWVDPKHERATNQGGGRLTGNKVRSEGAGGAESPLNMSGPLLKGAPLDRQKGAC